MTLKNLHRITCAVIYISVSVITSAVADTSSELAELRAMVLALRDEVTDLKQQLAEKEAQRDVAPAPKLETDSPVRQPVTTPAIASVSSRYGLSLYGYFKLDTFYNSGLSSKQEIPYWVLPDSGINQGDFDLTAKETRIGMDFAGPEVMDGKVSGKLELDFYGQINSPTNLAKNHAYTPRSRHAYLNWDFGDWTVLAGKTWEPYIVISPQSLNFAYYNFQGQLGLRKTQLRLTRKLKSGLDIVGAVIESVGGVHGADLDGDLQDDGSDSEFPSFAAKFVYRRATEVQKDFVLGMSVVYGQEQLDLLPNASGKRFDAWAVTAAYELPVSEWLTMKTNAFIGSNMDSYWGGVGQGINLQTQEEIAGWGMWSQLQFQPTDAWSLNVGYSIDNPDDADLNFGNRTKNETWLINTYYNFHPSLIWGLEYMRGSTGYLGLGTADNDHIHSSLIYKF